MTHVSICIASAGRASLADTLRSLGEIFVPVDIDIQCIVADDSLDGRVANLIETQGPWPVIVELLPVGRGNVCVARNAALKQATGDWVAFIDDDGRVDQNWLTTLLSAQQAHGADCVFGAQIPIYPPTAPDWIVEADPFSLDNGPSGTRVNTGSSGNVLFRRAFALENDLWFDESFIQPVGEDTDFFFRFGRKGGRMIHINQAIVYEPVDPARLSERYIHNRNLRSGQSYARYFLADRLNDPAGRFLFYAAALAKVIAGYGLALMFKPFNKARALNMHVRAWRNVGKLREALGLKLYVIE